MTTKKMMRTLTTLAMLTTLTACSRSGVRTYDSGRSDKEYLAAMADYSAGRLESARKGFDKAIFSDPDNAAARFQLACLLQDHLGEPLMAFVEYQAFLRLDPNGDKAKIAADRARLCLKLHQATAGGDPEAAKQLASVIKENGECRARIVGLEKDLADARQTLETITRENKRLHSLLNGLSVDNEAGRRDLTREAELFGSDDEGAKSDILEEARDIARIAQAEDAVNGSSSSLLPKQADDAKAKRDAKKQSEREAKEAAMDANQRPETYTVVDGDTLYGIAQRFYGRRSAWEKIRDANKEKISNNNRLRTGVVLRLP